MSHFAGTGDPVLVDHGTSTPQHLATQAAVALDRRNAAAARLIRLLRDAEVCVADAPLLRGTSDVYIVMSAAERLKRAAAELWLAVDAPAHDVS